MHAPPMGRDVDPIIVRAVLGYVERTLGADAADRVVLDAAVVDVTSAREDRLRWFSRGEVLAIAREAALACADPEIGRRAGEELVRNMLRAGVAARYTEQGSVEATLPELLNAGAKLAATRRMGVLRSGPGSARIEAAFSGADEADPFFCGLVAGFYSLFPALFGALGSVIEVRCQCHGAASCQFEMTWDGAPEPHAEDDVRIVLRDRSGIVGVDTLLKRFEELQDMASYLATAEDVATVLERVTKVAGIAVSAPRFLLAVRTAPGEDLRVYQQGWRHDEAVAVAGRLVARDASDRPNELVVPVVSERRRYGVLAAVYSEGAVTSPTERRLLASYAKHAATALEQAAALESARQARDTATGLLTLARALGEVTTQAEVIATLVDVVPAVLECKDVWVLVWNPTDNSLDLASTTRSLREGVQLTRDDVPLLDELVDDHRAMVMDLSNAPPRIRRHLEAAGTPWCAVVPITARGDFLGVIAAGFTDAQADGEEIDRIERLRGLAGHAAAALDNARLLDRIRDQALRDPLTGLPNRPLMEDRANQALKIAARNGSHVGLLFVDLDRFKIVNDTLGHAAGDRLICRVAERIAGCLRASDTLARLGGDEFVVLLPEIEDVNVATTAAARIVDALREPIAFDGRNLFVSCSIGVAVSSHHGLTYSDLLQHADAAMYEAKAQGKNTFEIRATRSIGAHSQLDLEADLHMAADRGELTLLYQPQIDFRTMRVIAVEALLRWDHPERGRLAPDAFLPMAEESGLVVDLDRWVRETAVAQAVRWHAEDRPLRMAVNVSTRDLRRRSLRDDISGLLDRHGLEPGLLELEITDRVVMSEEDLPVVLNGLSDLGLRLAIDDFGTGTSVLGRLQRCPVDVLKIDKGFVQTITAANPDAPVVAALMSLAHSLGLEVVAEGVETAFQGGLLRRLGCHLAQGYFFSPPVAASDVEALTVHPAPVADVRS